MGSGIGVAACGLPDDVRERMLDAPIFSSDALDADF